MHCNALPIYLIEVSQKVGLVQELKIPSFISFVSTSSQIPCLTSHEDKRVVTDPNVDHTWMRDFLVQLVKHKSMWGGYSSWFFDQLI